MSTEAKVTAVIEAKDQSSKVLDTVTGSFSKLNTKLLSIAGAIGIAGGAMMKVVSDTAEFNTMIARAGANVDASAEQLKSFKEIAIDATKSTNFNATQAAAALYQLAGGSISAEEAMQGLQQAVKFATANGLDDLDESAITVANVMSLFKLSGEEAARAMDVLTVAGHAAYGTTQDLVAAFKEAAPMSAQLGVSVEETAALLSALGEAGMTGSEAGVVLKRAMEQLVAPTGAAKDNIENLGIVTADSQGHFVGLANVLDQLEAKMSNMNAMERAAIMSETFGQIAGPGMTALLNQGKEARDEFIVQMEGAAGATDKAAAAIGEANNPLQQLHNQLFEMETNIAPVAIEIFRGLAAVIGALSSAFQFLYNHTVDYISDALLPFVKVGQFLSGTVLPGISNAIKDIVEWFEKAIKAIERFFKAAGQKVSGATSAVRNVIGNIGNAISSIIPSFDTGGIVPGPIGSPMLAMVHGGERVIPNGSSSGISIVITGNNISSQLDVRDIAEQVGNEIMRSLRQGEKI